MLSFNSPPQHESYMLRFWQERQTAESGGAKPVWRFSLEDPLTGKQRAFAGLAALVAYLESQMDDTNKVTIRHYRE